MKLCSQKWGLNPEPYTHRQTPLVSLVIYSDRSMKERESDMLLPKFSLLYLAVKP